MKLVTICTLTTPELERKAEEFKPYTWLDFLTLKGIKAELSERRNDGVTIQSLQRELGDAKSSLVFTKSELNHAEQANKRMKAQIEDLQHQLESKGASSQKEI